jgi:hypothetical protein
VREAFTVMVMFYFLIWELVAEDVKFMKIHQVHLQYIFFYDKLQYKV